MRVTFPHIGYTWVPARAIGNKLGVDMIVPPLTSKRTLSLGVKYAPETLCLPFKLSLGNMIEGLEMGGDTIIMLGQYGPCRFGYYNKLQESILHELGYKFKMLKESLGIFHIIKFVSGASTRAILSALHFGMVKLKALDDIERLVYKVRAVERDKGSAPEPAIAPNSTALMTVPLTRAISRMSNSTARRASCFAVSSTLSLSKRPSDICIFSIVA